MSNAPRHLIRHPLPADLLTPLAAYLALRPAGASLLLESCDLGERVGRYSFVLIQEPQGPAECCAEAPARGWVEALRALAGQAPESFLHDPNSPLPPLREGLPVGVGCAGYLGFEAVGAAEPGLPLPAKNSLGLPCLWVRRFDSALVFDHLHQVAELQRLDADPEAGCARLDALAVLLAAGAKDPGPGSYTPQEPVPKPPRAATMPGGMRLKEGPAGRCGSSFKGADAEERPPGIVPPGWGGGGHPAASDSNHVDPLCSAHLPGGTPPGAPSAAHGGFGTGSKVQALMSQEAYEGAVSAAQELILDGDVYQLVPSQRFRIENPPLPLEAYRRLRRLNPSPYGFLLEWGEFALVGASPEMLVKVQAGEAETLPIAGTVPRGANAEEDAARFEALKGDPKELAEHQMLVDLARNDLGRVAVPGGVRVERPLERQRTSHVLHLTTTVKAQLKAGVDALDVLAAAFPAGTVSGAPKLRACQRIAELEGEMRGPYGGVLLRLGADGVIDTALILRTAVYAQGAAFIQAGAGVVRASRPEAEYLETLHKLGAIAEALGVTLPPVPAMNAQDAQVQR